MEYVGYIISVVFALGAAYALFSYRLKKLEDKVEEHNGYAKKFSESTKDIALIQKDIEYIKEKLK